jgi:hypothetical protein
MKEGLICLNHIRKTEDGSQKTEDGVHILYKIEIV